MVISIGCIVYCYCLHLVVLFAIDGIVVYQWCGIVQRNVSHGKKEIIQK